jgi:hypothetical protein
LQCGKSNARPWVLGAPHREAALKILSLLTKTCEAKTAVIMKTLSGTVRFALLAGIAIITVLAIRAFAVTTPTPCPAFGKKKFELKIGGPNKDDYVDVPSEDKFKNALKALGSSAQYCIRFKDKDGNITDPYPPVSIKTDKITTSAIAKKGPAGDSAANDPNVTYRVQSNDPADIKNILSMGIPFG